MATFDIDLNDLRRGPVEKSFEPSADEVAAIFEGLEDFEIKADGFEAALRAQLTDSTVHVVGELSVTADYQCGRCLQAREHQVETEVDFVLMSRRDWSNAYEGEEEIALSPEDLDVSYYEGEVIDLAPLIREAVLLELPTFPHCPEEMRQACDEAYEAVVGEETQEELEDAKIDLRWGPLKDLDLGDGDDED